MEPRELYKMQSREMRPRHWSDASTAATCHMQEMTLSYWAAAYRYRDWHSTGPRM
jgi:hypothetical protein